MEFRNEKRRKASVEKNHSLEKFKNTGVLQVRTEEWRLSMCTAPADNQSSVPSTHMGGGLKQLVSAQGELMPPFGLLEHLHSHVGTHPHAHTRVHTCNHIKSKANAGKEN